MKISSWKLSKCSAKVKEEFKFVSSLNGWQETSIFPEYIEHSCSEKADYEESVPSNLCAATEHNFQFQQPPPDGKVSTGAWMTKWRNRTAVKFSRDKGKQPGDYMGGVRKVEFSKCGRKSKCAHGIESLLIALEYIEMQERLQQKLFENRLNKRMHVMEGDMEKAGEGAPDLAKLLEDQSPAKEALVIAQEHQNGIQKQENEPVEPAKEDEEEAQEPASEIKEEIKEEEEAPAPKELPLEEEKPQSRPITPKEEEPQSSPPPPTPEVSRKRALDMKEPEPEGSSGSEESDSSRKRKKVDQETETTPAETPNRETRTPVDDERERMISDFVSEVSSTPDSLGEASERLAKEIESLGELAAAKEMEWNAILRVRKLKEEMLERLLRRKRMHCLEEQPVPERFPEHLNNKVPNNLMMMMMRGPRFPDGLGKQQRPILPKPSPYAVGMNPREGRNGPIVDVKSIIDDYSGGYRSRHPESAPRRGRRVRGSAEQRFSSNPSLISMANMALGTGASVRTVSDHVYNMGMEQSRREEAAIKEAVKPNGAKPYPEVTLHPVSPPSLLHQVLTKSTPPRPASFSPTLARLLTAPERPPAPPPHFRPPSRVSIADILSSTKKNRNEITITPVSGTPPVAVKNKEDVVLLDDDDGDGGDRLVIDEGSEEVPQCQGCRHKSAQFVCAGCGNQWYCSRDCQVSAWEEHSEVCTG
ncbi:calponin homology domain-containing protein DDB_G0272472 isoform X2 [Halyomorpha halys]|uniref:calponin homology domain-containing protein DDB_G0272472 isoform X2 n=1 Tax=Halyomorpha halys TaxID=286706 RepID=UPI0006D50C9A|nr:titin-like isoform X2 [Halyomorpha halys]